MINCRPHLWPHLYITEVLRRAHSVWYTDPHSWASTLQSSSQLSDLSGHQSKQTAENGHVLHWLSGVKGQVAYLNHTWFLRTPLSAVRKVHRYWGHADIGRLQVRPNLRRPILTLQFPFRINRQKLWHVHSIVIGLHGSTYHCRSQLSKDGNWNCTCSSISTTWLVRLTSEERIITLPPMAWLSSYALSSKPP